MTRDEIIKFLEKLNIKTELVGENESFKRDIEFSVYGIKYTIRWYVNNSTLMVGEGNRRACIPFKYMYYDNTYPLIDGNKSIGFSYTKNEKHDIWNRQYPFESFRIPVELENANAKHV